MTPQEKAKELFSKYQNINLTEDSMGIDDEIAKECAIIAVDEILYLMMVKLKWSKEYNGNVHYWQEVKEEIEKL